MWRGRVVIAGKVLMKQVRPVKTKMNFVMRENRM